MTRHFQHKKKSSHQTFHCVANNGAFVVADGNLQSVFASLAVEVDVDSLTLGHAADIETFARGNLGDGGVRIWEDGATVVEDAQANQVTGDGDVIDTFQSHSLFEGSQFASVSIDNVFAIHDSDSDVEDFVGLVGGGNALFIGRPILKATM